MISPQVAVRKTATDPGGGGGGREGGGGGSPPGSVVIFHPRTMGGGVQHRSQPPGKELLHGQGPHPCRPRRCHSRYL